MWIKIKMKTRLISVHVIFVLMVFLISACSLSLVKDVTPPPSLLQLSSTESPDKGQNNQSQINELPTDKINITPTTPDLQNKDKRFTIRVTGKIINNAGTKFPTKLPVTLYGFDGTTEVYRNTLSFPSDQPFIFENVTVEPGWFFVTSVDWEKVTFSSNGAEIEKDTEQLDLSLTIYETTSDLSILTVDRLHIFLDYLSPDTLRVVELYIISNNSMKILVPLKRGDPVVPFSVPKQAMNIQFQDGIIGGRYLQTESGFADTVTIPPGQGEYRVMYAFEIPYQQKIDFSQTVVLPIQQVIIMSPSDGPYHSIKVKSDFVEEKGLQKVRDIEYQTYIGNNFNKDSKLQMVLIDDTHPLLFSRFINIFSSATSVDFRVVMGLGILGVVLMLSGIWMYRRSKKEHLNQALASSENEAIHQINTPDVVIDAIIALDDLYKAGELPENAYQEQRKKWKNRLREMIGTDEETL
jgi:hypothetical protein